MKKTLSVLLAACLLLCCTPVFAAGSPAAVGAVRLRVRSDIAGCTRNHYTDIVEILSGNVAYDTSGDGPVFIANYAGAGEYAHMDAGRTYDITCTLVAAEGYALPDPADGLDLQIDCGKGATVISAEIVSVNRRTDDGQTVPFRGLRIFARVTVDGTVFQRIVGWFTDLILKIKAWSLY